MKWFDVFKYREGELYWKIKPYGKVQIGDKAGGPHRRGYFHLTHEGKKYLVHRIIWEMAYGPIPKEMGIDHINGIKADNRVDNLRLATQSQNNWNRRKQKNNTSGFKGVYWEKQRSKWMALIRAFGKLRHLGYFPTPESAYAARIEAEKLYHGEFAASEERKIVAAE